jgi:uncharacterized protein
MARWVVLFEDHGEVLSKPIRARLSDAHLAFLVENDQHIKLAGGLSQDIGSWYSGGLWIVEAENRESISKITQRDPYFIAGLRKSWKIALWGKAPCYAEVKL